MASRRRLLLMLGGLLAVMAGAILFNVLVNPWGAWRINLIPAKYRRIEPERVATPYLLRTARPRTVLLGASRVRYGMMIDQEVKDGVQNAALCGSHLPEIAKEVDLALRNPYLKRIIWGLEFYTFNSRDDLCAKDTCARLDGDLRIKLTDNVLSAESLRASYKMVKRALRGQISPDGAMPVPWPGPYVCYRFAHPKPPTLAGMDEVHRLREVNDLPEYYYFDYSAHQRREFLAIVDRIRDAHVELLAFIPPLSEYELEMVRQTGRWSDFQDWKRFLAQHINYVDFAWYNQVARTDRMFIDAWHMETAVGVTIMRMLLGDSLPPCGDAAIVQQSGMTITADNVDQMLAAQERAMEKAAATPNPYSRMVAAVILKRYGHIATPAVSASR
jgi:hypothetical protein